MRRLVLAVLAALVGLTGIGVYQASSGSTGVLTTYGTFRPTNLDGDFAAFHGRLSLHQSLVIAPQRLVDYLRTALVVDRVVPVLATGGLTFVSTYERSACAHRSSRDARHRREGMLMVETRPWSPIHLTPARGRCGAQRVVTSVSSVWMPHIVLRADRAGVQRVLGFEIYYRIGTARCREFYKQPYTEVVT